MPTPQTPTPATTPATADQSRQLSDARLSAIVQAAYVLQGVGR